VLQLITGGNMDYIDIDDLEVNEYNPKMYVFDYIDYYGNNNEFDILNNGIMVHTITTPRHEIYEFQYDITDKYHAVEIINDLLFGEYLNLHISVEIEE
jgi:hypothetical protein